MCVCVCTCRLLTQGARLQHEARLQQQQPAPLYAVVAAVAAQARSPHSLPLAAHPTRTRRPARLAALPTRRER